MINQLRADLYLVPRSAVAALCLLTVSITAGLYTWLHYLLATGEVGAAAAGDMQGLSDVLLVSLLGPLLYGVVVSQPFSTKSVHNALLGSSRAAFVASKTVTAALLVAALSLPYGVAVLVGRATGAQFVTTIHTGFSLALGEPGALTWPAVGQVLAITLTSALLAAAKLSVCLPLAFWLRRPLVVMAFGFVWSFIADLLADFASRVDVLDALIRLSPFSSHHMPAPESSSADFLATIVVSVVFIALMGAASWLVFRRADVK